MEQRLSMVSLGVADLTRAITFYREVIGWTPFPGPEGIAFFDLGGLVFALYPHEAMAKEWQRSDEKRDGAVSSGFALAHNVGSKAEVDAIFTRLGERDATILKAPEEVFWGGYSGYFSDPDGHPWEVAYNPFWEIQADGRISMGEPPA